MLDLLTCADFARETGTGFRLEDGTAQDSTFVLVEATELSRRAGLPGAARTPFTLVFRGPADPVLPQRTYALENPALGRLEIFLVPVGRDAAGVLYEAVFN